jgi:hypothetical protein
MSDPLALACAELVAAMVRLSLQEGCAAPPGERPIESRWRSDQDHREAWQWLITAPHGPWAASRRDWCLLAGLDPEVLRQQALRRGPHPRVGQPPSCPPHPRVGQPPSCPPHPARRQKDAA